MAKAFIVGIVRDVARLDIETVRLFIKNLTDAFDVNARELSAQMDHANELLADQLGGDYATEIEVVELGQQLSMVALYRFVETTTKKLSHKRFPKEVKNFFSIKELKKAFLTIGFNVEKLPEWPSIDELRCINNSVKHEYGYVSNDLAKFPGWKEGEKLNNLPAAFERLAPAIPPYLMQVAEKVLL